MASVKIYVLENGIDVCAGTISAVDGQLAVNAAAPQYRDLLESMTTDTIWTKAGKVSADDPEEYVKNLYIKYKTAYLRAGRVGDVVKNRMADKMAAKDDVSAEDIAAFKEQIGFLDDMGEPMGVVDEWKVWKVNGDQVKIEEEMDFVEAGNGYRWKFIPRSEIWVDQDLEPHDWKYCVLHEVVECRLMEGGMGYDAAHEIANRHELAWRKEEPQ